MLKEYQMSAKPGSGTKKDRDLRKCVSFHKLNVVQCNYGSGNVLLPSLDTILKKIGSYEYHTSFYPSHGFLQNKVPNSMS